jgi:hypothetical protein
MHVPGHVPSVPGAVATGQRISYSYAALPPYSAVRLRLTVKTLLFSGGCASKSKRRSLIKIKGRR